MNEPIGKQAMELASKLYRQQEPINEPQKSISQSAEQITSILWQKMTDGYQHLWANTYGQIGGPEYLTWAKAIDTVDPKRAMQAISDVLKEGAEYPPNLIKFLRMCRQSVPAYHKAAQLPPPRKRSGSRAAKAAFSAWEKFSSWKHTREQA